MIRAGNLPVTQGEKCFVDATNISLIFDFNKIQVSKAMGALLSFLHRYPMIGADFNITQGIIDIDTFTRIDLFNYFLFFIVFIYLLFDK